MRATATRPPVYCKQTRMSSFVFLLLLHLLLSVLPLPFSAQSLSRFPVSLSASFSRASVPYLSFSESRIVLIHEKGVTRACVLHTRVCTCVRARFKVCFSAPLGARCTPSFRSLLRLARSSDGQGEIRHCIPVSRLPTRRPPSLSSSATFVYLSSLASVLLFPPFLSPAPLAASSCSSIPPSAPTCARFYVRSPAVYV